MINMLIPLAISISTFAIIVMVAVVVVTQFAQTVNNSNASEIGHNIIDVLGSNGLTGYLPMIIIFIIGFAFIGALVGRQSARRTRRYR